VQFGVSDAVSDICILPLLPLSTNQLPRKPKRGVYSPRTKFIRPHLSLTADYKGKLI